MTAATPAGGMLNTLRIRIEELPLRRRAAELVRDLRQSEEIVTGAAQAVADLARVRDCIHIVFPDASTDASSRMLASARTRAAALRTTLKTPDNIRDPNVERGLGDLRRAVQAAQRDAQTEWRQQIQAVADRYGRLVNALHDAQVPGSGALRAAVERVRRMQEAPTSGTVALSAAEDIEAVIGTVRDLGLEGPVGEFLTAAAEKRADARALRNPEIVAFLDKHDLWSVLAVSLQ